LLAKKYREPGCIAVQVERNETTGALVEYLSRKSLRAEIQIVIVSSMEMFGEYKPYHVLESEKEFIDKVLDAVYLYENDKTS